MWALLLAVVLVMAGCGNDAEEPEATEVPIIETVDLDEVPTVAPPTASPTPIATASPEPTPPPLPDLRVWPTETPLAWPRTPDEAAAAFAQHVARGEKGCRAQACDSKRHDRYSRVAQTG